MAKNSPKTFFFEEMCFFAISQSIFKILVSIFQVMGILDFLRKIFLSIGIFCLKKWLILQPCPQYVFVHKNGFWSPGGVKKAKKFLF